MADLLKHLEFLVGSSEDSSSVGPAERDLWQSFQVTTGDTLQLSVDKLDDLHPEPWNSVLDIYHTSEGSGAQIYRSLVTNLSSRPDAAQSLESLRVVLSSSRANEEISGVLTDLFGLHEMELVTAIIENRDQVVNMLSKESLPESSGKPGATAGDDISPEHARKRMERGFRDAATRPLFSGTAKTAPEILPHVYSASNMSQGTVLSQFGSSYALPIGTTRHEYEVFEEVVIPPARPMPPRRTERLIPIPELDPLLSGSFMGYSSLNRIQSIVYPTAYGSNENMLICAPTGAGKTDVAMLSILRVLNQHRHPQSIDEPVHTAIDRNAFKIIYVAPMKALASEIVRKLGKRLKWLSIRVRELTGDMQLTKQEIAETQIIVTTPEKWDVVTRQPSGEGGVASMLKLLIIDEVHLLNEDRGAVIETIVARTLRQVESSQSVIRIVGLSATLPNYLDVAEFLSVSPYKGLFYFDSSFRPIPLQQHFIGIRGKPGSQQSRRNLDHVTFKKVSELVSLGHQVMVFVHARRETVKTAINLMEEASMAGLSNVFSCEEHPEWTLFRRNISESRNKEMRLLFDKGFGIHHAGMLRSDRNMMERMFEAKAIKVLCCTATLAWGVNLPAHAVIIKGTQVYDSSKGSFIDLSVLDVLQIFGRAGRPGFETAGEGFICTTEDKLNHYLENVTSQHPIESRFTMGIVDALNAEIALGTVVNTHDAVRWLGYTYLFVRMRKNPFVYGMSRDMLKDDPQLGNKRHQLVTTAARQLAKARMIIFDEDSGTFTIKDLGRIAAKYYVRHISIEVFNKEFRPKMGHADVLAMLCMSSEFDQIQLRESEIPELEKMLEAAPCDVKGGTDTSQGKVNILLQAYISRLLVDDFALVSDTAYVSQNGGRIIRALLEIGVSHKWASVTVVLTAMSKAVEKRLWPFDHPLKQFGLKPEVMYGLETHADELSISDLRTLSAVELGSLVHLNEKHGAAILTAAKQFPAAKITYDLQPLSSDVLKIVVLISRAFEWGAKIHGPVEPFWLWIEDHRGTTILQLSRLAFLPTTHVLETKFVMSIPINQPPPSVTIRFVSDTWIGAEEELRVPLNSLSMPISSACHSTVLDLPFLPLSVVGNTMVEKLFAKQLHDFNAIQTQVIWSLFHSRSHFLLCAPTGCGKSTMARILILTTVLSSVTDVWVLVVSPRTALAFELASDIRDVAGSANVVVDCATSQNALAKESKRVIRVVTTSQLLGALTQQDPLNPVTGLDLVVCENLELLDPAYELSVSLLRHLTQSLPTRYVGFSQSLNDPTDLAAWLGVDPYALYSFQPNDRDQALAMSTQTFTIPPSAALFKAMAKPAYRAIQVASSNDSAIVFVPSRGQCRFVALDLITQSALGTQTQSGFLPPGNHSDSLENYLIKLQDQSLRDLVSRGVCIFHYGLQKTDRKLILDLYSEGVIRVLIVPREACWTLPVRAAVVVVMGTQYFHTDSEGLDRQLRDYRLAELVHMQGRAIQPSGTGNFHLFCQTEARETIIRFLSEGLPLESRLLSSSELVGWYKSAKSQGRISKKQQSVEALSFTYVARRIVSNPLYYNASDRSLDEVLSRVVDGLELEAS